MQDRQELIKSRIKNIKDPIQKALLRDILYDVINEMFLHTEEKFEEFHQKIDSELQDDYSKYYIYMAVCKREDVDETSGFLFEVNYPEEEDIVGTIFLECDYITIANCLKQTFKAIVTTDKDTYDIEVVLKYSQKYLSRIEWLYKQFQTNKKLWRTINSSFVYKFLDIIDIEHKVPKDEKIVRCQIDISELNSFIRTDMVLLWNVQLSNVVTEGKIITVPGINSILYEHKIKAQLDMYAYMLEDEEVIHAGHVYTENQLIARAEEKLYEFNLVRIASIDLDKDSTKIFMPLQTNKRIMSYIDRLADSLPLPVLTKGEIERIFNQYTAYENLRIKDISIVNECSVDYLDLNPFIKLNEFLQDKKILLITFESNATEDIFLYEKMYFLVTELQLYFQEYKCIGEMA